MAEGVCVLHVDDEPGFVELTAEVLPREDEAIEVETATSASEGLERLAAGGVDCVISDYDMPGTDGIEFLESVRDQYGDLPFVLYTGKGSEEVASDAISAGVTDYLQKEGGTDQYALLANRVRHAVDARLARERSQRRKREYRTLIESSPVPIAVVDADHEILYLNPSAAETLGTDDPEEPVDQPVTEFIHPDDVDAGTERVRQVFADREPVETREYRIVPPDGDVRHVRGNVVPVTFEGQAAAQLVFTDVTEQKEREAALKRERERFLELFEEFPEPTMAYGYENGTTVVRDINSAFVETFGYDPEVAIGTRVKELVVPPTEGAQQQADELKYRVKDGEQVDVTVSRQTADGTRWFNFRNVAVPGVDDIDGYGVYADVHERVRREEQLKTLHDGTRQLLNADEPAAVAETVATVAKEMLGYEYTAVRFVDEDGDYLWPVAATEELTAVLGDRPDYPLDGDNPHARVYRQKAPIVYDDVQEAEDGYDRGPVRSAMYLPIGEHGVVIISALTVGAFDLSDVEIASILTANAQAALDRLDRESEVGRVRERFQAFVEHASDIVTLLDEDGTVDYLSPAAERVLGYPTDEMVGENIFDLVHAEDRQRVRERFREMIESGEPDRVTAEFRARRADETWIWLESVGGGAMPGDDGGYLVTSREITEHKRREQELERERKRFSALFENFPEPTVAYGFEDGVPVVRSANEAFAETFGYDADAIVGSSLDDLIVPPGKRAEATRLDERVQAGELVDRQVRRRTADGERNFNFRNIPCPTGDDVDGFAIYADVTERVERERQLERQNERLEQFASIVSHDLRNPLNAASARVELAASETDSEQLAAAEAALDRIESILDDTLELARHGQTVLETEPVALRAVAEECWGMVAPDGATPNGSPATLRVEDDVTFQGNRGRLKQVFENLFRNSLEHATGDGTAKERVGNSPPGATAAGADHTGDGGVTIRVGAMENGIYVADDGPGIPESDRDSVFEPGHTTAEDGTGFGLAIVREIVDAEGWEIAVTESADGGARFEITGIEIE